MPTIINGPKAQFTQAMNARSQTAQLGAADPVLPAPPTGGSTGLDGLNPKNPKVVLQRMALENAQGSGSRTDSTIARQSVFSGAASGLPTAPEASATTADGAADTTSLERGQNYVEPGAVHVRGPAASDDESTVGTIADEPTVHEPTENLPVARLIPEAVAIEVPEPPEAADCCVIS